MKRDRFLICSLLLILCADSHRAEASIVSKCSNSTAAERFLRSNAVFTGEVVRIDRYKKLERVKFRIIEPLKNVRTQNLAVFAVRFVPEAARLEQGKSYLVYAHKHDGRLMTGGCSETVELKSAGEDLKQIERIGKSR